LELSALGPISPVKARKRVHLPYISCGALIPVSRSGQATGYVFRRKPLWYRLHRTLLSGSQARNISGHTWTTREVGRICLKSCPSKRR
jgi:hypothetical protein